MKLLFTFVIATVAVSMAQAQGGSLIQQILNQLGITTPSPLETTMVPVAIVTPAESSPSPSPSPSSSTPEGGSTTAAVGGAESSTTKSSQQESTTEASSTSSLEAAPTPRLAGIIIGKRQADQTTLSPSLNITVAPVE